MFRAVRWLSLVGVALLGIGMAVWIGGATAQNDTACVGKISTLGDYCGYTEKNFDGYRRTSRYIDLPNGARLAVDILRPTTKGVVVTGRLPVLFNLTVYSRAMAIVTGYDVTDAALVKPTGFERMMIWALAALNGGEMTVDQAQMRPWIQRMLQHGYVVVAVDASGTGASFGQPLLSMADYGAEAALVMDWITKQPWASDRIGMFGQSFVGMTAVASAAQDHPALKAVYASSVGLDAYRGVGFRGGIRDTGFIQNYIKITSTIDTLAVPVDADHDRTQLKQAQEGRNERHFSHLIRDLSETAPYTDSISEKFGLRWQDMSLYPLVENLNRHRTPIYLETGWKDIFTRDTILLFSNLKGPKRLLLRPWHHRLLMTANEDIDPGYEAHRWFDYWLKDVDNGVVEGPEIGAYLVNADREGAWHRSANWPPEGGRTEQFCLHKGEQSGGALESAGQLRRIPISNSVYDQGRLSDGATSGVNSRWNGVLGTGLYQDFGSNDAHGMVYTTDALEADVNIVGFPEIELLVQIKNAAVADLVFYLEDVAPDGSVSYMTETALRTSHRKTRRAVYGDQDLVLHDHRRDTVQETERVDKASGGSPVPMKLKATFQPVSYRLQAGHRLRLAIQGSDRDNLETNNSNDLAIALELSESSVSIPVRSND